MRVAQGHNSPHSYLQQPLAALLLHWHFPGGNPVASSPLGLLILGINDMPTPPFFVCLKKQETKHWTTTRPFTVESLGLLLNTEANGTMALPSLPDPGPSVRMALKPAKDRLMETESKTFCEWVSGCNFASLHCLLLDGETD